MVCSESRSEDQRSDNIGMPEKSGRVESPFCDFMTYMTLKSIMNRSISLAQRRNDPKTYLISFVNREAMLRRRIIPGRAGAN